MFPGLGLSGSISDVDGFAVNGALAVGMISE